MKTQIGKWGKSYAVRIPGVFAKELGLTEGMEVELTRVKAGILLSPRKREYSLEELLEQVTPENIHGETHWGPPVSGETT